MRRRRTGATPSHERATHATTRRAAAVSESRLVGSFSRASQVLPVWCHFSTCSLFGLIRPATRGFRQILPTSCERHAFGWPRTPRGRFSCIEEPPTRRRRRSDNTQNLLQLHIRPVDFWDKVKFCVLILATNCAAAQSATRPARPPWRPSPLPLRTPTNHTEQRSHPHAPQLSPRRPTTVSSTRQRPACQRDLRYRIVRLCCDSLR